MPEHTVKLLIDQGVYPTVMCPFDPADEARPCWPHTEYGERFNADDGTKAGCVYIDWVEEVGIECCASIAEFTFLLKPRWDADSFEFDLGEQVAAGSGRVDDVPTSTSVDVQPLTDGACPDESGTSTRDTAELGKSRPLGPESATGSSTERNA